MAIAPISTPLNARIDFGVMINKKTRMDHLALQMGARLKKAREARGLSQAELARMASINGARLGQSAIANFEGGIRRIRHENALSFERIFGIPAGYFLCVLSEEEAAIISAMRAHKARSA